MLKIKYKLHKLVNILFYFLIFIFGFLIGLGGGKIEKIFDIFRNFI